MNVNHKYNTVVDNDIIFCLMLFFFQRIQIGLYVVHIQEWFQAFSRENVFILRTEDWHLHKQMKTLPRLFKFLGIGEVVVVVVVFFCLFICLFVFCFFCFCFLFLFLYRYFPLLTILLSGHPTSQKILICQKKGLI